jgi:hypothetical protein
LSGKKVWSKRATKTVTQRIAGWVRETSMGRWAGAVIAVESTRTQ